eukprot:3237050-Amphidinium_carterae.3
MEAEEYACNLDYNPPESGSRSEETDKASSHQQGRVHTPRQGGETTQVDKEGRGSTEGRAGYSPSQGMYEAWDPSKPARREEPRWNRMQRKGHTQLPGRQLTVDPEDRRVRRRRN